MLRLSISSSIAAVCVVAAAGHLLPGKALAGMNPADVAGRWTSDRIWQLSRAGANCDAGDCALTLDIVPCGDKFCGIEVGKDNACGATALKLDAGKPESGGGVLFSGKLELARGSEPYVLEAYLRPAAGGAPAELSMSGDTGGEFRSFRRSFPFHATLARAGEPVCTLKQPVS